MATAKSINYFSIADVDLRQLAGQQSHLMNTGETVIVLNGRPADGSFLREGQVYQVPEPRLILITDGEADVHLNLEQHHFSRGMVILTAPDTIMEIERCSPELTICGMVCRESHYVGESIIQACTPSDFELLRRMIYLAWDVTSHTPARPDTVRQLFAAAISNVLYIKQESDSTTADSAPSRSQVLFQQFKGLVNRHCEQHHNIPFYAECLHVSPHHLSAVISKASGHSVMYWINRAVVLRAKVLLRTSQLMTYEVAERLHFANPPAFNNFFKKATGMTPRQYREGAAAG